MEAPTEQLGVDAKGHNRSLGKIARSIGLGTDSHASAALTPEKCIFSDSNLLVSGWINLGQYQELSNS